MADNALSRVFLTKPGSHSISVDLEMPMDTDSLTATHYAFLARKGAVRIRTGDARDAAIEFMVGPEPIDGNPLAKVLSAGNRELLRIIAEKAPGSLEELARITGKAKSNLSRTLRAMEGYGLVRLERGERGRITPKVMHDRVELDLPLTVSRKAS
jgi:DNA-binding transcriptional ArsR family regulator